MRKILPLVVVGFLVLSGLGAVALPGETTKAVNNDQKFESISFSQPVIEDLITMLGADYMTESIV